MSDPSFKPSSHAAVAAQCLDQIFRNARTHNAW